ncbi:uncharacterized protein LOC107262749 [Cephus cinctus]|uniref:Uncharacterized protein LOC107262749 n=1 Tax=Cephus cinctus TaxID=211228 RepID=A0AAJ7BFE3_CEPCN|nr:uncharacterized protein LOC107262749 [Cephus cinctus]
MSFSVHNDDYRRVVEEAVNQKESYMESDTAAEFLLIPKHEQCMEQTMVVGEEIVTPESIQIGKHVCDITNSDSTSESNTYLEENVNAAEHIVNYHEPSDTLHLLTEAKIKQEWNDSFTDDAFMQPDYDGQEATLHYGEEIPEADEEDAETIATFVTSAGQQLALYAVEDSDEVFAVAVYDESGEPPTNFQFLLKADVERLIGEGAVRTVKKPTQMKNQLVTTHPPVFLPKQEPVEKIESPEISMAEITGLYKMNQKSSTCNKKSRISQHSDLLDTKPCNVTYSSDRRSDITYVMMDDTGENIMNRSEESQECFESDNEIIEQSTVQYILLEGDQSDSELTFDEIQATLRSLKTSQSRSSLKKPLNGKVATDQKTTNGMFLMNSPNGSVSSKSQIPSSYCTVSSESGRRPHCNYGSSRKNHISSSLMGRKYISEGKDSLTSNMGKSVTTASTDNTISKKVSPISLSESKIAETVQTVSKVKRSRKQQLTLVNRGDSEIIIQPASLLNEEDNTHKKRGRRKKKPLPDPDYNPRPVRTKRVKKSPRYRTVEVIEIDIDEEEGAPEIEDDAVEIAVGDPNKEKGSSDKENDVIMVGDSDNEFQVSPVKSSPAVLQCEHCSRNFRQQRALDTHSRVCPKSPTNAHKTQERAARTAIDRSNGNDVDEKQAVKKQYTCKVCQEKFDVVVALARHARTNHSQRKKGRPAKIAIETKPETPPLPEPPTPEEEKRIVVQKTRKKKNQSPNRIWNVKKLSCTDCGRWFPSAASLSAHCLQHATKMSEQQRRRCQTCKKLIKSRSLYIRHIKMHSKARTSVKSVTNILQKKLRRTRQAASKITSLRKRGRPRKL